MYNPIGLLEFKLLPEGAAMVFYNAGILILLSGVLLVLFMKTSESVSRLGRILTIAGDAAVGIAAAAGMAGRYAGQNYVFFWSLPLGQALFSLSPLSSFFLLILALVTMLAAIFAPQYLEHYRYSAGRIKYHWAFFLLLTVSMMFVVTAGNAVFFMLSWEAMSVSSFFLVMFEHQKPEVRKAGWVYFVFMHIGAVCLVVMFAILGKAAGSYNFAEMLSLSTNIPPAMKTAVFILSVFGFGMKAGIFPLYAWMPEAYRAAPADLSAVMSGVMKKTALWGLISILSLAGCFEAWMGWTLLVMGLISGLLGIAFAAVQNNAKRLLAYSSGENVGIISMAAGIWILGASWGNSLLEALGFTAMLVHILNHALFKSLLFLGAGAMQSVVGTVDLDKMGGLLKKMPKTGLAVIAGGIAICGLPPFNGFISEFLIYVSAFYAGTKSTLGNVIFIVAILGGLSMIGALAVFAFSKFIGTSLLGEPRSGDASHAHEVSPSMYAPLYVLAALSLLIGIFPEWILRALEKIFTDVGVSGFDSMMVTLAPMFVIIRKVVLALGIVVAALALFRNRLLSRRRKAIAETWGCGFDRPSARMQYTASSFAEPLTSFAGPLYSPAISEGVQTALFPAPVVKKITVRDLLLDRLIIPAYRWLAGIFEKFSVIQHGNTHLYVLYIVIALLAALIGSFVL